VSDSEPEPGQDLVDWAYETGRIPQSRVEHWRKDVAASAPAAEILRILAPGLRPEVVAASAGPRSRPLNVVTATASVTGSAVMGRNPIVAAARQRDPRAAVAADARGPAPTLFAAGDLPPFTASGIDPNVLLQVPWQARQPIAAAPSTAEAYALVQRYSGADAEADALFSLGNLPANVDYQQRTQAWLAAGMTDDEVMAALFPPGSPQTGAPVHAGIGNLAYRSW
jgi:hypothetical protein